MKRFILAQPTIEAIQEAIRIVIGSADIDCKLRDELRSEFEKEKETIATTREWAEALAYYMSKAEDPKTKWDDFSTVDYEIYCVDEECDAYDDWCGCGPLSDEWCFKWHGRRAQGQYARFRFRGDEAVCEYCLGKKLDPIYSGFLNIPRQGAIELIS